MTASPWKEAITAARKGESGRENVNSRCRSTRRMDISRKSEIPTCAVFNLDLSQDRGLHPIVDFLAMDEIGFQPYSLRVFGCHDYFLPADSRPHAQAAPHLYAHDRILEREAGGFVRGAGREGSDNAEVFLVAATLTDSVPAPAFPCRPGMIPAPPDTHTPSVPTGTRRSAGSRGPRRPPRPRTPAGRRSATTPGP